MITKFKLFEYTVEYDKEDNLINYLDNFKFIQTKFNDYYWKVCNNSDYEIIIKTVNLEEPGLSVIKSNLVTDSFAEILFKESDFETENDFIQKIEEIKEKCKKERTIKQFKI